MRATDVMTSKVMTVSEGDSLTALANYDIGAVAAENVPGVRRVEDHMRPVPAYLFG